MRAFCIAIVLLALPTKPVAAEAAGPRIFISVDMEGIAGVVTGDQLSAQGSSTSASAG